MNAYNLQKQSELRQQELIQDATNEHLIREINRTRRANRPSLWQRVRIALMSQPRPQTTRPSSPRYGDLRPADQEG